MPIPLLSPLISEHYVYRIPSLNLITNFRNSHSNINNITSAIFLRNAFCIMTSFVQLHSFDNFNFRVEQIYEHQLMTIHVVRSVTLPI